MATWHQNKHPVKLYGEKTWNVIIDPPNEMRAVMTFTTRALADVYMRNLKANNPRAFAQAYILKPAKR